MHVQPQSSTYTASATDSMIFGTPPTVTSMRSKRGPDGAKRNPGRLLMAARRAPDFAALHPGYALRATAASVSTGETGGTQPKRIRRAGSPTSGPARRS